MGTGYRENFRLCRPLDNLRTFKFSNVLEFFWLLFCVFLKKFLHLRCSEFFEVNYKFWAPEPALGLFVAKENLWEKYLLNKPVKSFKWFWFSSRRLIFLFRKMTLWILAFFCKNLWVHKLIVPQKYFVWPKNCTLKEWVRKLLTSEIQTWKTF